MMHSDDGNKSKVSSSNNNNIIRPENLSKGQLTQIQSQVAQKGKQIFPALFFDQQKQSENRQNSKATPGLGHCTRNAEERF